MYLMISISPKLFLASSSLTRKKLLKNHGIELNVAYPEVDEDDLKKKFCINLSAAETAMFLAKAKALSVSTLDKESFFIAADQVCELDGKIFDKPLTEENAVKHLQELRSKTHIQNCATVIYHNAECIWEFSGKALLTMRNLEDEEIVSYVELDGPLNSAGSYMFEKHGKHLFSDVQGDHDVILGLPVVKLVDKLYELGLIRLN
jgi:septum formation protein